MKIVLETAPTSEPVTLAMAKEYLRETSTAQDALIEGVFIKTARRAIEQALGGSILNTTWKYFLDRFPDERCIELPRTPLVSVTHVKYYDENDVQQTLDPSKYQVDPYSKPGRIVLVYQEVWPTTYQEKVNAIEIQFVSGFGENATNVPEEILEAICLTVGHFYENRVMPNSQAAAAAQVPPVGELPMGVHALIAPYMTYTFL